MELTTEATNAAAEAADPPRWRIDRTVPIALILALVMQTGGAVWYFSQQNAELGDHEKRIVQLETAAHTALESTAEMKTAVGRIDERTKLILDNFMRRDGGR